MFKSKFWYTSMIVVIVALAIPYKIMAQDSGPAFESSWVNDFCNPSTG